MFFFGYEAGGLCSLDVAYGGLKATPALRSFLDHHQIDYSAAGRA